MQGFIKAINKVELTSSPQSFLQAFEADKWQHNLYNDNRIFPCCIFTLRSFRRLINPNHIIYNVNVIVAIESELNETPDYYRNKINQALNLWLKIEANMQSSEIAPEILGFENINIREFEQDNSYDICLSGLIVTFTLTEFNNNVVCNSNQ